MLSGADRGIGDGGDCPRNTRSSMRIADISLARQFWGSLGDRPWRRLYFESLRRKNLCACSD
jgi:hypothetical protein